MEKEPNGGWSEVLGEAGNMPNNSAPGDTIHTVTNGKTEAHQVAPIDGVIRAEFERWIRARAKRVAKEIELEDGDEADLYRRAYAADYAAGHYNWEGKHCRSARKDEPGLQFLFYLMLRRCNPQITEARAGEIMEQANKTELGMVLRWALGNSRTPPANGKPAGSITAQAPITLDSH